MWPPSARSPRRRPEPKSRPGSARRKVSMRSQMPIPPAAREPPLSFRSAGDALVRIENTDRGNAGQVKSKGNDEDPGNSAQQRSVAPRKLSDAAGDRS